MVGTAGLPHILTRYYTTPSVREARTSVAWSLFFIFLLYFTAPAYAAFARFNDLHKAGRHSDCRPASLGYVVGACRPFRGGRQKLGDGIVQWADFVVKSTDFVVLSMPEVAGLPFVITGLVMAGGLAAALSTADGLLLTIANAFSHDLYYNVIDPKASLTKRLTITKDAARRHSADRRVRCHFPARDYRRAGSLGFQSSRSLLLPRLGHGHLVEAGKQSGACVGMIVGLAVTAYYMIGSRFFGVSWFGTQTIASAVFGLPVGFHYYLDRLAAYRGAAEASAGSRGQRALSEEWAGRHRRSAGPRSAGRRPLVLSNCEEREGSPSRSSSH